MSNTTISNQTGNFLQVDYDITKIFVFDNKYEKFTFENNTGAEGSFPAGTLLGRKSNNGNVVALDSSNSTNGENLPVGVLAEPVSDLADAGTMEVLVCVSGAVVSDKLDLVNGSDTLNTVISSRRLADRIKSDTLGVYLVESDQLTKSDNS